MERGGVTGATVREWHSEDGWGVVDSVETPGGCWTHFSAVAIPGYRSLVPDQEVELEWERAEQDGFDFRTVRVWPRESDPVDPVGSAGAAMRSSLTITFDPPAESSDDARSFPSRKDRGD